MFWLINKKNNFLAHTLSGGLIFCVQLEIFFYRSVLTCVLGAQKNLFIETVLLSTHNIICFGLEIR